MATKVTQPTTSVLVEHDAEIAYLTLNRPEKRNALSLEIMETLRAALQSVAADSRTRVVILKANGAVFSAGHDLRELVDRDPRAYEQIFDACVKLMETIQEIPQPVIAQVQGPATAAGCQLVATCDLAVAATSAWFATPGVKIGLFCSTPMVALSRSVNRKKAMEMLLTGEPVSATEAADIGLINKAVAPDQLDAATQELVAKILASSPRVVALGKHAFYRQIDMPQRDAYDFTRDVMSRNAQSPDAHEGITAFLEKRRPAWPAD